MNQVLLGLLATSAARLVYGQLSAIPSCADSCALNGISATGCAETDIACICKASGYIDSVAKCVQSACSQSDQQAALCAAQSLCGSAGVNVALPAGISAAACSSGAGSSSSAVAPSTSAYSSSIAAASSSSVAGSSYSSPASSTSSPFITGVPSPTGASSTSSPFITGVPSPTGASSSAGPTVSPGAPCSGSTNYCAGGPIILRCNGNKLSPGNCNDNLNFPPLGALCVDAAPSPGGSASCSAVTAPSSTTSSAAPTISPGAPCSGSVSYCAGGPIILRCSGGNTLYAGNCNDNLNEPPLGAVCVDAAPSPGGSASCSAVTAPTSTGAAASGSASGGASATVTSAAGAGAGNGTVQSATYTGPSYTGAAVANHVGAMEVVFGLGAILAAGL
jgi:hypothetical protein